MSATTSTERGRRTRGRILDAAAELFHVRGVAATGVEDVLAMSGAGRSQLYHHFTGGKEAVVDAVIDAQTARIVATHCEWLAAAVTVDDLRTWADRVVAVQDLIGDAHGCPLGTLAAELSDRSEAHRLRIVAGYTAWELVFVDAVQRLVDHKAVAADTDVAASAAVLLTALQGGLLLTRATRDDRHLRLALTAAVDTLA